MLKEETFPLVAESTEQTLRNLIAHHDTFDLQMDNPEEFEKSLIREIRFLALYDDFNNENPLSGIEKYVHEHVLSLYLFARDQTP